jgi:hypothetical protein
MTLAMPFLAVQLFTMIDESAKEDDCVFMCRAKVEGDDVSVEYFPQAIDLVSMEMWTKYGLRFDGKAHNHRAGRSVDGKPERSQGVPDI